MTMETVVILWLVGWFVVIPSLVVGLRLRRARYPDRPAPLIPNEARRACEGRKRSATGRSTFRTRLARATRTTY